MLFVFCFSELPEMQNKIIFLCLLLTFDSLACPVPFTVNDKFCLHIRKDIRMTWQAALKFCRGINGRLVASIDVFRNLDRISGFTGSPAAWAGVNDIRDERVTDRDGWKIGEGDENFPLDNSVWKTGMPDNFNSNQDCVAVNPDGLTLNDHDCNANFGFACEPAAILNWRRIHATVVNVTEVVEFARFVECLTRAEEPDKNCRRVAFNSKSLSCWMADCPNRNLRETLLQTDEWTVWETQLQD
jgi:hypothetical protein